MSGLFPNAWHVARREYLTRVRGRTFAITTGLLALLAAGVILLPVVLDAIGVDDPPEIAVYVGVDDLATDPVPILESVLATSDAPPSAAPSGEAPQAPGSEDTATITRVDDPDAAAAEVRDGQLDGLLTITRRPDGDLQFEFLGGSGPGSRTSLLVAQATQSLAWSDRLRQAGVSAGSQAEIFEPPDFTAIAANPDDVRNEADFGPSLLVAYAVVILTFMAILTYGNWVAQSVAEEKSSRVMELLITSATPRQLLAGKVLGTGAAGLTQYAAILVIGVVALVASGPIGGSLGVSAGDAPQLPTFTPQMIGSFVLFFLGGFVLYCTLYAAAGSMVSRQEDVQQASGLLVVLAMLGYLASFAALNDPEAGWVAILSLVPFFSPYLMPARMLLANPPFTEVLLGLGLLAVTILAAIWVAARIYSAGVLLYGQRPGIRQVLRATRVAR